MVARTISVVLLALALGCGPGSFALTNDTSSTSSTSSTNSTSSSESGSDDTGPFDATGSSEDSSDSTSETGWVPFCGDGIVGMGETCDDGAENAWEGAACQPDCTLNECGDSYVGLDENCDPGTGEPNSCIDCPMPCGNAIYECGDTIDNDNDGLIDFEDPDCVMYCDNAEDKFDTSFPSGGDDCRQDCAWDSNSGVGDDHCEFNLKCDVLGPGAWFGCGYDPNFNQCPEVDPDCLDFCLPKTPNGCDCFGCCEIAGEFRYIGPDSNCGAADPSQCALCTPNPSCVNPCEPEACELCFLQSPDQLAPGCAEPSCPDGFASCTTPGECQFGEYCQTGCCVHPFLP